MMVLVFSFCFCLQFSFRFSAVENLLEYLIGRVFEAYGLDSLEFLKNYIICRGKLNRHLLVANVSILEDWSRDLSTKTV